MKFILFFLAVTCAFVIHAKVTIEQKTYVINSDVKTNDLPAGQVRVKGNVEMRDSDLFRFYTKGVMASTLDNQRITYTDSLGNFELIMHETYNSIYIYFAGYKEIKIDEYDFIEGHTIDITFRMEAILEGSPEPIIAYKPIIYLYSESEINTEIKLTVKGNLTFTYPIYNDQWNVNVANDKLVNTVDNKEIPYLFWEGELNDFQMLGKATENIGWLINADSIVSFLESELTKLGLNRTEQSDFITFWAPRMLKYEFLHVQFFVDVEYENQIAELSISPNPDAIRRVYMVYRGFQFDPEFETSPQIFEKFERFGFTVVEWGGSELKTN